MTFILYLVCGFVGGILGGMGMGGGTILIPLLTIFFNVSQLNAQGINLISFIPMAVVALIIHLKNKLVDFKKCLFIILPGLFACVGGCFLARSIGSEWLKRIFGGFLIIMAIFQLVKMIIDNKSN